MKKNSWVFLLAMFSLAAQDLAAQNNAPDLSGYWERHDDVGGGSFGGIFEKIIPKAELKPEVIQENQRTAARQAAGDVVSFNSKWCLTLPYPFFMQHSAAWSIAQSESEIVQVHEVHAFPRHIYMDGRKHPEPALLNPSTTGHSIGHWEGETLVVDTIGFIAGGTPGGGKIGPGTQLKEQFRLIDGGKKLSVTFAWSDPAYYVKPHIYELQYYRSEPGTYAFEEYCHADDPNQNGSAVEPKQK